MNSEVSTPSVKSLPQRKTLHLVTSFWWSHRSDRYSVIDIHQLDFDGCNSFVFRAYSHKKPDINGGNIQLSKYLYAFTRFSRREPSIQEAAQKMELTHFITEVPFNIPGFNPSPVIDVNLSIKHQTSASIKAKRPGHDHGYHQSRRCLCRKGSCPWWPTWATWMDLRSYRWLKCLKKLEIQL